jgi:hypothetical protein
MDHLISLPDISKEEISGCFMMQGYPPRAYPGLSTGIQTLFNDGYRALKKTFLTI